MRGRLVLACDEYFTYFLFVCYLEGRRVLVTEEHFRQWDGAHELISHNDIGCHRNLGGALASAVV